MMKFAILLVLFVSAHANPFPFLGGRLGYPHNLDTPDDDQVNVVAGQGVAGQANEDDDTLDDGEIARQGATGQGLTTLAPVDGGDSSSSSSSEEEGSVVGGGGPTEVPQPAAGPIQGGTGGNQAGGAQAGESSDGNVDVARAGGGPILQPQGDTSTQNAADPGVANPLNLKPLAIKQHEATQSTTAIAFTTLGLVAGVAAVSVIAYKYRDAIRARVGL